MLGTGVHMAHKEMEDSLAELRYGGPGMVPLSGISMDTYNSQWMDDISPLGSDAGIYCQYKDIGIHKNREANLPEPAKF